ncbi:MAG: SIS domain-containing protein [Planctomycetes bacterium]|nr:SIS domain-containing protein [Planctomycetota bacterium]
MELSFPRPHVQDTVARHFDDAAKVLVRTAQKCTPAITTAADLIASALAAKRKLMICGNGGSAADCQHLAAEFTSRLSADFQRPGLAALALTTDTSFITAYTNDFDFNGIFARQVQALGQPDDVLLCISTSGRSANVLRAARQALDMGLRVVALTGVAPASDTGRGSAPHLTDIADIAICIPSDHTQHVQEAHLAVEHMLCHCVERQLFGEHGAGDWS